MKYRETLGYIAIAAIIATTFLALGCGDDDELTVLEPSENVPTISIVNDGLLRDGRIWKTFGYHLQSNVVLEHDIIVHIRISDIGDDNIVKEGNWLFLMSAGSFRSELLKVTDSYITESEVRRRNEEHGENGWWGLTPNLIRQWYPPADRSLAGGKGLSWPQKHPSTTVTILPANTRTNDILPRKISNTDMTALVDHPFRQYRLGKKSSLVLAPRDYQVVPPPNYLPPRAKLIEVNPRDGQSVEQNTILTLTFDQPVAAVAGATGAGTTWKIPIVQNSWRITWRNKDNSAGGPSFLFYSVRVPPPPDTTPPTIRGGNLTHGALNVEPGTLNHDRIEVIFDEDVTGAIELRREDNTRLDWRGTVSGRSARLHPGRELLELATTYRIIIDVSDDAGNKARIVVEFTTKLKEAQRWR